ncbi:MAG: 16S rRNA (cytosine(967)-C(5))-methyltransferase RsmB, partial [Gammaproteobacteria bacterium]
MSVSPRRGRNAGRNVRARAAREVAEVVAGRSSLTTCYSRWAREDSESSALLRALVTNCLRWHHRLQWQLEQLLDRPLPEKEAELAALLRLGLLQLQFMRIPAHAAVHETVAATRALRRQHSRSLVNAVLRRFQREQAELERRLADNVVARVSHPAWFIDALREDWPDAAEDILFANNLPPPLWLRVNRRRITPQAYAEKLSASGIAFVRDTELPQAIRLESAIASARIPGFADGEVSLQDRAAQCSSGYLDLAAGQRVLDACAAPGGKTAAMLEQCSELQEVVALDRSETRVTTLRENLERLGLRATVTCADACETEQWWDGIPFDRILLDVPCSATGVIRRHPDIKLRRTPEDIEHAVQAQ